MGPLWHYQADITSICTNMYNVLLLSSTAASQSRRERKKRPCVMFTRRRRSTFTVWPTACPHAPCAKFLAFTKTARWRLSAPSTRQRRWGLKCLKQWSSLFRPWRIIRSQVYLLCLVIVPQTELSDGIAMMVGSNDRMQGIISQLEEACRAIEVSVQLLQCLAAHSRSKLCSVHTL